MFVGGSTLLTETYLPTEKAKAQGLHDLLVFCTTGTPSFSSGLLLKANGWVVLNYVAMPFLAIAAGPMLSLLLRRRSENDGAR